MSAQVAVIMGSKSDWETMSHACVVLEELGIPYEKQVVSAHRTPDLMFEFAENAARRGLKVIIAGAGGAAHLPGMVAAKTLLPVIGVPVKSKALKGLDSLLSIVQMPGGIPVATVAIGKAGATNAGLLAAQMLGAFDPELAGRLQERRDRQRDAVLASSSELVLETEKQ
ncbi:MULTISPECIES: 5-(carboxyamino)imidazole ribonucleotide mutase [Paenibacillus]|uniref:N5-carboxyaminoimidazole ribonucleotide mutase n=1 Tax=Paenibacillus vini TaxID=1476024 RepID=A0ABQ4MA79_9BACL|nr:MULTISPECIES: 5-(carboxyamino)imidazole ribonucleotide mutase [Paenibacillus]MBQ4900352.1 5-(carboxyamino)imidazole ribonucleotide mutase [Paenibacillus sp. Marseille-P2973]MDN4066747.1 5-(carboxyamino)imidazole ribonucleotide mutase [Paenibacillus vini]GIP52875.1 N5-carboxyaminoimidazole ribonucleotide mutase [Paenibacillus vini]